MARGTKRLHNDKKIHHIFMVISIRHQIINTLEESTPHKWMRVSTQTPLHTHSWYACNRVYKLKMGVYFYFELNLTLKANVNQLSNREQFNQGVLHLVAYFDDSILNG